MMVHDASSFRIYFGDKEDAMYSAHYLTWQKMELLLVQPRIKLIAQQLQIQKLFFLRQVHSTHGSIITAKHLYSFQPFVQDGDFLITSERAIGLGIMAADCLPVICVDRKKHVIGIAHVGWRGAIAGVVDAMLAAMQKTWATSFIDCTIFLGPSAQQCCYQVGPEFQEYLVPYPEHWIAEVLSKRGNDYFFNVPLLVQYQLNDKGISTEMICTDYNQCTMCHDQFYSHRRGMRMQSGASEGRQMTIVVLK